MRSSIYSDKMVLDKNHKVLLSFLVVVEEKKHLGYIYNTVMFYLNTWINI